MAFVHWLQRRRLHALVVTVPFWTITYVVGAVLFHVFPFGAEVLWSRHFFAGALLWGFLMGTAFAFLPWPQGWKRRA